MQNIDLGDTDAKNIATKIELIKALIATLQETLNANTLTDLERLQIWNQKHKSPCVIETVLY